MLAAIRRIDHGEDDPTPRSLLAGSQDAEQVTVPAENQTVRGGNRGGDNAFAHRILREQLKGLAHPGSKHDPILARGIEDPVPPTP